MANILEEIVAYKRGVIEHDKAIVNYSTLYDRIVDLPQPNASFKEAITNLDYTSMKVIAEVKKASPSKGIISADFDHLKTATNYEKFGAHAVSVLTDEKYFMGANRYLKEITDTIALPCIRKDFIVDPYQILQAKELGASAYLLIVDCLSPKELTDLIQFGKNLGLDALVETHRADEVTIALDSGAEIIGVNNRNLRTFETDLQISLDLRPMVPENIPFISESGISSKEDITLLLEHKTSAVLVGESLMRQGPEFISSLK
ncbi:MAG: indole-3-glycerol phosphate synthase TrpC [Fibrobacterales bacterium]